MTTDSTSTRADQWWRAGDDLWVASRIDPTGASAHTGRVERRIGVYAAFDATGRPLGRYSELDEARAAVSSGAPLG